MPIIVAKIQFRAVNFCLQVLSGRTQGRCGVGLSHRRSQLIFQGITHLGVGRFYNFDIGGIVLTIVSRRNGRVNPVGTGFAWMWLHRSTPNTIMGEAEMGRSTGLL